MANEKRPVARRSAPSVIPAAPAKSSSVLPMIIGGLAAVSLLVVMAVVLSSKKPAAPVETHREPTAAFVDSQNNREPIELPPAKPPTPRETAEPRPEPPLPAKGPQGDVVSQLDLQIYRLNTAGFVAQVLEVRGQSEEARKLRQSMVEFEAALKAIVAGMKAEGRDIFVPDYLRPTDVIVFVDRSDLTRMKSDEQEQVLVGFVSTIKAGARAQLLVKRGPETAELRIVYHQRPKELYAIMQVASIIPGQGGTEKSPSSPGGESPAKPDAPVKEVDALGILADPAQRAKSSLREDAATNLRWRSTGRNGAMFAVAAWYLGQEDAAWRLSPAGSTALQAYFDAVKIREAESFDKPRHLGALTELAKRIQEVKSSEPGAVHVLTLFASAHASDAEKAGAVVGDIAKAAPGIGIARTADGKRWGDELSVLFVDLGGEITTNKFASAMSKYTDRYKSHPEFGIRYFGMILAILETFDRNSGGFNTLVAAVRSLSKDGPTPESQAHLGALADRIESFAKCSTCQNGRIVCNKCGGDGKYDMKCPQCAGTGNTEKGGGRVMCNKCNGAGTFRGIECSCGKTGNKIECPACKGKLWHSKLAGSDQTIAYLFLLRSCKVCRDAGSLLERVVVACPNCVGLGKIVVPVTDPAKTYQK